MTQFSNNHMSSSKQRAMEYCLTQHFREIANPSLNTRQIIRINVCTTKMSKGHISTIQAGIAQIGTLEVSGTQISQIQVRLIKIGPLQMCHVQISTLQMRST